jgi:HEAT repeat protein
VTFPLPVTAASAASLVGYLADPHRRVLAYQLLLQRGGEARDAVCQGLGDRDPQVRAQCCRVLDHIMDAESVAALVGALSDPAEEVRVQALHALACERCKDGQCRPAPGLVLPSALRLLGSDASARVRTMAVELVAAWADTHPAAAAALATAATADGSSVVRKKASWYIPGGTIYRRTHRSASHDP